MSSKRKASSSGAEQASKVPRVSIGDAYDSDREPPAIDDDELQTWKLDPQESHSDWTIEIVSETTTEGGKVTTKTDTYHVHKHVLSTGPRKSEYFTRLFQNEGRFAESQSKCSRIELHELAAKAFPAFLSFLYAPEIKKLHSEPRERDCSSLSGSVL